MSKCVCVTVCVPECVTVCLPECMPVCVPVSVYASVCVSVYDCCLHFWAKSHEFVMRSQGQPTKLKWICVRTETQTRAHTHIHQCTHIRQGTHTLSCTMGQQAQHNCNRIYNVAPTAFLAAPNKLSSVEILYFFVCEIKCLELPGTLNKPCYIIQLTLTHTLGYILCNNCLTELSSDGKLKPNWSTNLSPLLKFALQLKRRKVEAAGAAYCRIEMFDY